MLCRLLMGQKNKSDKVKITKNFISVVDSSTYGAKMPRANWDFIGNLTMLIPPKNKQQKISNYLNIRVGQIDFILMKANVNIEHLQEYRTALISAAVTGKIDVRKEES